MKPLIKNALMIILLLFVLTFLCACVANPATDAVTSKNDGSFDANVVQSAIESGETENINFDETFTCTDGSVKFRLNICETIAPDKMPVVEVVPHYLSVTDVKRVAEVLFGEVEFYEAEPILGELKNILTMEDVESSIQRWLPYTTEANLLTLYPQLEGQNDKISSYIERIRDDITLYNDLKENIEDKLNHSNASWKFQSEWNYMYSKEQLDSMDIDTTDANEQICVTTTFNGIPYLLNFSVRNQNDYKLNTIFVYPYTVYSPKGMDANIFRAQLCRTSKPSESQIAEIGEKAQKLLDQMELGNWKVDQCYLQTNYAGKATEYMIYVTAVPSFNQVPAIRRQQLSDLTSHEAYASNYYLTDVIFQFSANGDLLYLQMSSPIDIKEVINENVKTLTISELIEKAKFQLALSDYHAYGVGGEYLEMAQNSAGEDFICNIELCDLEYGMTRVKVPNTDNSYYYVPSIILSGTVDYCGKETGAVYEASGETFYTERIVPIIAINAIDGSIILLDNG